MRSMTQAQDISHYARVFTISGDGDDETWSLMEFHIESEGTATMIDLRDD